MEITYLINRIFKTKIKILRKIKFYNQRHNVFVNKF